MSHVYFVKHEQFVPEEVSELAKGLLQTVVDREAVLLAEEIPLKVHFGERGNVTYIPPTAFRGVIDFLQERGIRSRYIETNVLYRGSRTTRSPHLDVAATHGFTDLPITIADGDHGEERIEVPIAGDIFDHVKLGKAFADFEQYIVLAHFKGHEQAGFGGAMKQLAMGFAARAGKLAQHSTISPLVNIKKCIACGICVESCDPGAITVDQFAVIDPKKCIGCAACISACPTGAIRNDWGAKDFTKRVAEYAYGAAKGKRNIYINFVYNITKYCDCNGAAMELIANDIGILASTDPVAIDRACLDLVQEREGKRLFEDGRETLQHAEKMGLGSQDYQLILL